MKEEEIWTKEVSTSSIDEYQAEADRWLKKARQAQKRGKRTGNYNEFYTHLGTHRIYQRAADALRKEFKR